MEPRHLGCYEKFSLISTINLMPATHEHSRPPASGSVGQGQVPRDMQSKPDMVKPSPLNPQPSTAHAAILTASRDRPYALGLAAALMTQGVVFDFVGGDGVDSPELHGHPQVTFLNLRNQREDAGLWQKTTRVLVYYLRLIRYAATARPRIFHILWNNKFELFDRTWLMAYYRLLGKKIVFTVHNVNIRARDGGDSRLNRATLKFQYRQCDHIFVHTEKMGQELQTDYGIPAGRISLIPFGVNNTVPNTALTKDEARRRLGLGEHDKTLLFFGNIAPYKGLEYLVAAFIEVARQSADYRLIIAGRPKGCDEYWAGLLATINASPVRSRIILKIEYVPDAETEIYFKAADVLVLPYTHIFQSGVLFLGYGFGLPVLAADVGSLKTEIIAGETGFVFRSQDSSDLQVVIEKYFASNLYRDLDVKRKTIRDHANEQYSWTKVGEITRRVYVDLLTR